MHAPCRWKRYRTGTRTGHLARNECLRGIEFSDLSTRTVTVPVLVPLPVPACAPVPARARAPRPCA